MTNPVSAEAGIVERLNDAASILEQWDAWEIGAANKPSRRLSAPPAKFIREAATLISTLQAENARMREALDQGIIELQSVIDTQTFNSRHMMAEDSLQDAWRMLDMAKEQFGVDANSVAAVQSRLRSTLSGGTDNG